MKLPVGKLMCLAILVLLGSSSAHASEDEVRTSDPILEYATVASALNDLRLQKGLLTSMENGWTIITDPRRRIIWSFSPPGYPAYPAVVKRRVVKSGDLARIEMSVLCEATNAACADLVRTFSTMGL